MPDLSPFAALPDEARLWVHPAATPLDDATQAALLDRLHAFFDEWTSHQHSVEGAATILYDRFLVLAAVRIDGGDLSGCGIDDAFRTIDEAASTLGIEWTPSLHVLYRTEDGTVVGVPRSTFQEHIDAGTVTRDTTVFDPSITTLGALRRGSFELPARESWHAQLFAQPSTA